MLSTFDRALVRANRWVVIAILAAMATMVFANVALRFLTDYSILWVEEASRYTMVWLTFIGAGPVLRYGGHIGIDSLQQATPRFAPLIRAVVVVIMALFFCAMSLRMSGVASSSKVKGPLRLIFWPDADFRR